MRYRRLLEAYESFPLLLRFDELEIASLRIDLVQDDWNTEPGRTAVARGTSQKRPILRHGGCDEGRYRECQRDSSDLR